MQLCHTASAPDQGFLRAAVHTTLEATRSQSELQGMSTLCFDAYMYTESAGSSDC